MVHPVRGLCHLEPGMGMEASKRAELVQGSFLKAFLPLLISVSTTEEMFVVPCVCC